MANSDFHRPEHLYAWKTLLNADRTRESVLAALKRGTGIGVLPADAGTGGGNGVNVVAAIGLAGLAFSIAAYVSVGRGPFAAEACPARARLSRALPRRSRSSNLCAASTRSSRRTWSRSSDWTTSPTRSSSPSPPGGPRLPRRARGRRPPSRDSVDLRLRRPGAGRQREGQPAGGGAAFRAAPAPAVFGRQRPGPPRFSGARRGLLRRSRRGPRLAPVPRGRTGEPALEGRGLCT